MERGIKKVEELYDVITYYLENNFLNFDYNEDTLIYKDYCDEDQYQASELCVMINLNRFYTLYHPDYKRIVDKYKLTKTGMVEFWDVLEDGDWNNLDWDNNNVIKMINHFINIFNQKALEDAIGIS
jgi:hypothetical protein